MSISQIVLLFLINVGLFYCEAASSGKFRVYNTGGYVATFKVSFQINGATTTYDGEKFTACNKLSFNKNKGDFGAGSSRTLELPVGVESCQIEVSNAVFFGTWRRIFYLSYNGPVTKCFQVWGTTFYPAWEEQGC